jgi:hypothetical protein
METIREMILARADDDNLAILFEDQSVTYREYVQACIARAHLLLQVRAATEDEAPRAGGTGDRAG